MNRFPELVSYVVSRNSLVISVTRRLFPVGASPAEETAHFFHGLLEPPEPLQRSQAEPDPGLAPPMPNPSSIESVLLHASLSPASSASSA